LQSIVSREIDPSEPAVLTIGKFEAGSRNNVIAEDGVIIGTTRCYNIDIHNKFEERIRRVAQHTAKAHGASADLDFTTLVVPVVNDATCSAIAEGSVEKILSKDASVKFPALNVGEDYSYFMEKVPSIFALVGCMKAESDVYPHHHPKFDIDEDSLEIATALYAQYAIDFLTQGGEA
jgi:amidohydrolase